MKKEITIRHKTESYNKRRYGKPYMAKIPFANGEKQEPIWAKLVGGMYGDEGLLTLPDLSAGDCLMVGQKDFRGRNSAPDYYEITNLSLDDFRLAAMEIVDGCEKGDESLYDWCYDKDWTAEDLYRCLIVIKKVKTNTHPLHGDYQEFGGVVCRKTSLGEMALKSVEG